MKVAELIKELERFPDDMEVIVDNTNLPQIPRLEVCDLWLDEQHDTCIIELSED
jgi:hypothetical protein